MFHAGFSLWWPWRERPTVDYIYRNWHIFGTKNLEFQVSSFGNRFTLLAFEFRLEPWGQSHGGASLVFELLNQYLNISVYDSRHWDQEENKWETTDEKTNV